jgi:hypothetical protein
MAIEIPKIMRTLERDERGYPIPFIVQRDLKGLPVFTVNDDRVVLTCVKKRLCSICGKRLQESWFVSGSRSFLSVRGAFVDPPVHLECAEYALQVCPFLAAPVWTQSIAHRVLAAHEMPKTFHSVEVSYSGRLQPDWFCLGLAGRCKLHYTDLGQVRYTVDDWRYIEFWKAGARCNAPPPEEIQRLLSL